MRLALVYDTLILLVFYVAQCLPLVYQQCLQKTHYRLICLQHQPLSLLNVEIATIWRTISDKGNINNTSAITFLIGGQKLPAMLLCLGEPPVRFLWCWLLLLFFIFVVILHSLLFHVIPHPSVDYRGVFTTILYFQPSPSQSDSRQFHFQPFQELLFTVLKRALRFCEGIFYPQAFFTFRSFTDILPAFIKASLGAGSFSLKFAGLHTNPRNTGPANRFFWFTVIHNPQSYFKKAATRKEVKRHIK